MNASDVLKHVTYDLENQVQDYNISSWNIYQNRRFCHGSMLSCPK